MPRKYNVYATHVTEERWHNIECSTKIQRTGLVASVLSYLKLKNYDHLTEKNLSEFKFIINYCFSQYTLYNTLPVGVSLVQAISKGHRL